MDLSVKIEDVSKSIILVREHNVIIDSDVALLYGVWTKDINKAVKNNPQKFPDGYVIEITKQEFEDLRRKFSTTKFSKTRVLPKAFTEKGLYMLATILKSEKATNTTIAIIESFARFKNLSRNIKELSSITDEKKKQIMMKRSGELITEILDDDLATDESETSIEINFAVLKFKHTIKKKKPQWITIKAS